MPPIIVFEQIVGALRIVGCPFDVPDHPRQSEARSAARQDVLDQGEHGGPLEPSPAQIGVPPGADLAVADVRALLRLDAGLPEPPDGIGLHLGIDDVERALLAIERLLQEGHRDAVLVLRPVCTRHG